MDIMDRNHKIKVELVSRGAEKGRAYHQVALKGAVQSKKTGEVLSEGEFRVVSLAAFLADLSSWNKILPFIFDDPITSLDHKYEKMVANRLVQLSLERQVIVFTHRLAFAQLLVSSIDEYNKNQLELEQPHPIDLKQVELRNRPLGEPVNPTYHGATKMKNALNNLKNRDIALLKKLYKNGEYESYDNGIKSLCSDFRKIVEQGIETDLLSKIVTRFGYSVNTLRLKYLYIISPRDVDLFNNMMTKYSAYEHSQSTERPVELPELSNIEADVDTFITWCDDFGKRCNEVDKKK
jgi:energy-coupling factor transporter ATP-binding protein EcfA2